MILLTSAQARMLDRQAVEAGLTGLALMEAAAAKACVVACGIIERSGGDVAGARVVVLAGRGNNGGDGIALARHLRACGADVTVYLCAGGSGLPEEAAANLAAWRYAGGAVRDVTVEADSWAALTADLGQSPHLVVDALLGIGQQAEPRGTVREAVTRLGGDLLPPLLSLDIPTGLNADTGAAYDPHVTADVTVTFGLPKVGLYTGRGRELAGEIILASIGLPAMAGTTQVTQPLAGLGATRLFAAAQARALLHPRPAAMHKGEAGRVVVVAGSPGMTGAAALTGLGALRGGAGLVTIATPASAQPAVAASLREALTCQLPEADEGGLAAASGTVVGELSLRADAMVVGPGLGTMPATAAAVRAMVAGNHTPLIVDADGLNAFRGDAAAIAARTSGSAPLVITPHPGEAARLLGTTTEAVEADRLGTARALAAATNAYCLLKGSGTVVAAPSGQVWVIAAGNPGMATGGAGDVLAGLLAAIWAYRLGGTARTESATPTPPALDLVALGAYLHALAGDLAAAEIGPAGLRAGDIAEHLPRAAAASAAWRPLPAQSAVAERDAWGGFSKAEQRRLAMSLEGASSVV